MKTENRVGIISIGEIWFVHQGSLTFLPTAPSSSEAGGTGERNGAFVYEVSLAYFDGFSTYHKIKRHGSDGFTSRPKEGMLRIFIALKNRG
jgi:hypothetical protein